MALGGNADIAPSKEQFKSDSWAEEYALYGGSRVGALLNATEFKILLSLWGLYMVWVAAASKCHPPHIVIPLFPNNTTAVPLAVRWLTSQNNPLARFALF